MDILHISISLQILTTLTLTDIVPSTKTIASMKFPDYSTGKVRSSHLFLAHGFVPLLKSENDRVSSSKLAFCFLLQLEAQYFHHHATVTTAVALKQSPAVDLSITLGTPTFSLGAEAGYETATGKLTKYTAGISVRKPDSCAAIIL